MTIRTRFQKLCSLIIVLIIASFIPTNTVDANWNGAFSLSSSSYLVYEYAGSVTITIRLSGRRIGAKPWTAAINYATTNGTATAPGDYTTISGSKTFRKAGSWSFNIPITNNTVGEGTETFTVAISSPTNGATLGSPSTAVVTILDDDIPGIAVTPTSGLNVTEAGGIGTFSVVLAKQPTSNVTIALSSSDTTEGTVAPVSLLFTPVNWYLHRTVSITGVDDLVDDGDIGFTITTAPAVSGDPAYSGMNGSDVTATCIDDDTAGITVTPTSGLSVTEASGTATFMVVLNTLPTLDVTIGLSSSDTSEGTVSPSSLTFTTSDWNTPQAVTVTGVADVEEDGNIDFLAITAAASSGDINYSGIDASDVTVTNIDDDKAGITVIHHLNQTVTEAGGQNYYDIFLNTQPSSDVTLAFSSSDTSEGTVSPASMVFTNSDWNQMQILTVTGVDDQIDDGDVGYTIIISAASSDDFNYQGLDPDDELITTIDDDTAGITVTPTSGLSVTEGGGITTFNVVLNTPPTASVIIGLSSSDTSEGTVSPSSLTFTDVDWSTPKAVTVTGVDDPDIDGNISFTIITAAATSDDGAYNGLNASDVTVINIGNDAADITAIPTSGLSVTEAGGTATFTIVLNALPAATVSIALSSSDTGEGTVSPASLTFTTSNWSTAQLVSVTGVNDDLDDGDVNFMVSGVASSMDTNYDTMEMSDVSITCVDNDIAGFTVTPTSGLSVTEAGGTATFTATLNTQPSVNVSIALTSSDTSEGTVSPATLTFTNANWSTPQTVTVTGVDDLMDDGDVVFTIVTDAAISTDPVYNGLDASDVSAICLDDDAASNTPPIAVADDYSTMYIRALNVTPIEGVLANDSDADADILSAVLVDGPTVGQGSLSLNPDGSFTFTPATGFVGDATFTYQAFDGTDYSTTVTVTIHVIFRLFQPSIIRP